MGKATKDSCSSYEQMDGVAIGASQRPLLANTFMLSLDEKLEWEGKLPFFCRRYIDHTLTVMPIISAARAFLHILNHAYIARSKVYNKSRKE